MNGTISSIHLATETPHHLEAYKWSSGDLSPIHLAPNDGELLSQNELTTGDLSPGDRVLFMLFFLN